MMSAAEGRPCSVCLREGPWRRSVKIGERGSLESSRQRCVGLVGFARFTPGVGYTLVIWASLIAFSASLFTHMNNDQLFQFGSPLIYYAQHVLPLVGTLITRVLIRNLMAHLTVDVLLLRLTKIHDWKL